MSSTVFEIAPGRFIGGSFPCFIISEIGQNHQGDVDIAKQLINVAVDCGVDCVKFQKSDLKSRFSKNVLTRPYESKNSWGNTYGAHREKLELTEENFIELKNYADRLGIYFSASGMDNASAEFLAHLGVPFFKIGSADTTNLPLLRLVSKFGKPLIISTGMTDEKDLRNMYSEISKINKHIALLQCTSCYPTLPQYVNLNVIQSYKKLFPEAVIGYSGHEIGTGISLAAVSCGAKVLERHITLDNSWKGSDHVASLNPKELKYLVNEIRMIEKSMGSSTKQVQDCELLCYEKLGKTVVTTKYVQKGSVLNADMIAVKVASIKGIDPINYDNLIGKKLKRNLEEEQTILLDDIL